MRPRFRSEPGPRSSREGRPLELVRVRGSQRDSGHDGRELNPRRRRRGGRRRARGPQPPPPRPGGFSLRGWLASLFARRPAGPPGLPTDEQEARVLREFSRHYGISFRRPELLKLALTHRSYLSVTGGPAGESNERLEFLGDSVLGLVTSEHLFRTHPNEHEGQLTKTKSLLVSKAILSRRALAMGLGRFVLMSHSEIESGGRQRLSILADAFESVIGAIYLDQGFEAGRAFIDRWLLGAAREIVADKRHVNYKSHLQEYVQSTFRTHPVYRIRSEMGPDHSKHFMVEVVVGRRVLGEGKGRNKKEAEQAAARDALDRVTDARAPEAPRRAGREGREGREREAGPREGREHEAAPRELLTREGEGGPGTETDEEGMRRRRRRGRRGGRGRRRPEGEAESGTVIRPSAGGGEEGSPAAAKPAPRTEPPRPAPAEEPVKRVREIRQREIEPLPPAAVEDELDEVGRPEGPPGEHLVDPFETEPAGLPEPEHVGVSDREQNSEPAFRPPGHRAGRETAPEAEESTTNDREGHPGKGTGAGEEAGLVGPGKPDREDPRSYGRRPGRAKRNPGQS